MYAKAIYEKSPHANLICSETDGGLSGGARNHYSDLTIWIVHLHESIVIAYVCQHILLKFFYILFEHSR